MRKNGTLTFIVSTSSTQRIGDHLGSSSLVTDATGTVINQTQYKAWGETRYSSGSEQTKYTYTGQYSYVSDFGLHFYNARWYDSSLSRFAQADTIVPGGVQGYDRYAYTNNNPINYTDPSGHDAWWTNDTQVVANHAASMANSPTFTSRFNVFYDDALGKAQRLGKENTLEGMARIVESAAKYFDGNWDDMMQALGMVFLGLPENNGTYSGPGTLSYANTINNKKYNQNADWPYYFLGEYFKDEGFNKHYQDGENQIYHVWGFIANTTVLSQNSYVIQFANHESTIANNYHEFIPEKNGGGSRQDFLLSRAGIFIGNQISNGTISPYELGDTLRTNLGENASVNDDGVIWQAWVLPDASP